MPLKRGKEEYLVTMNGVRFLMQDGDREVSCRAARELLRNRFGSTDRESDLAVFKDNRDAIEGAANEKYQAGNFDHGSDPEVMITEHDMASSLSKKMQ